MKIKKRAFAGIAACLIALGMASSVSAATQWCITLPTGQELCFPLLIEEIPIKVRPDHGPYRPVDILELSQALKEILILGREQRDDPDPDPWVFRDAQGQRVIVMDFEAGQAYEIPQPQRF